MNPAAPGYPPGHLRVSDAGRDRALAELTEAFQAGRITASAIQFPHLDSASSQAGTDSLHNRYRSAMPSG
jgi:hypothetical protein